MFNDSGKFILLLDVFIMKENILQEVYVKWFIIIKKHPFQFHLQFYANEENVQGEEKKKKKKNIILLLVTSNETIVKKTP